VAVPVVVPEVVGRGRFLFGFLRAGRDVLAPKLATLGGVEVSSIAGAVVAAAGTDVSRPDLPIANAAPNAISARHEPRTSARVAGDQLNQ
jgi:hypothetical protein